MNGKIRISLFLCLTVFSLLAGQLHGATEIRLTILYDNYLAVEGMEADWGFSCLVQGAEKTILFDTGSKAAILQKNIERLGVDLKGVDMVLISHLHGDHIGGLEWVLSQRRGIPVLLPAMAADEFVDKVRQWGGLPQRVKEPRQICRKVYSTGEMPADFDPAFTEQSLVFQTTRGLLVIAGCAHPGIVEIVRRAAQMAPCVPRVVLGGFHLMRKSDGEVRALSQELKRLGVERCGASHCSGDRAIALIREAFADHFLKLGVGAELSFPK